MPEKDKILISAARTIVEFCRVNICENCPLYVGEYPNKKCICNGNDVLKIPSCWRIEDLTGGDNGIN